MVNRFRVLLSKKRWVWTALPVVATLLFFQNCDLDSKFKSNQTESPRVVSLQEVSLPDSHPVEVEAKPQPTTYDLILADRYYLQSLFEDVFGDRAIDVDSNKIFLNAVEFGSPCEMYNSYLDADRKLVDAMENCGISSSTRVTASVLPKPSVSRQGLLTRACSDLVQNPKTMRHAIRRIASRGIPAATDANIIKLYKLFYRGKPEPTEGVRQSLKLILDYGGGPTFSTWRSAIFTVCTSSYWQVI